MRVLLCVLAVGAVVGGELSASHQDVPATVVDAAAGAAFLAVGIASWSASQRHAVISFAAGLAWFAGGVAESALWVHRPLMLHAALAFPHGRHLDTTSRVVVAAYWMAAVLPSLARSPYVSLGLSAAAAVAAWRLGVRAPFGRRGFVRTSAVSATILAAGLALPAAERLVAPDRDVGIPPSLVYAGFVAGAGLVLLGGRLQPRRETDEVIELTHDEPSETLAALRRESARRRDPASRRSLDAAIELLETNRGRHADLAVHLAEVRASRRRLVEAAVVERQRLERQLADGAVRYLDELADLLTQVHARDADVRALAEQAIDEVARTREDLEQLARGLHPRVLAQQGLSVALAELGARSPVPTEVHVPDRRFPELVEATVWYACAEAMANLVKHASAASAGVELRVEGDQLVATVRDDGVGGARTEPQGGLAGLADRLGAVDGRLTVVSPSGGGTQVILRVPVP